MTDNYQERTYRQLVQGHLEPMRVTVQETDLGIYGDGIDFGLAKDAVIEQRGYIEGYILNHPEFSSSLSPLSVDPLSPPIVQDMMQAGIDAGVGPMAAVAGALAERVAKSLLKATDEVIIENGGDIFLNVNHDTTIGIYAGRSLLNLKVGLKVPCRQTPLAICTSSGTIGHSKSFGVADTVCVVSRSGALADAAATSIANRVTCEADIDVAIQWGQSIGGVIGVVIIIGEKMGAWGQIELVPLEEVA